MLKKRKSLAFVLALIMILTLIPASAFATTTNSATKVPTVAADEGMPVSQINLTVNDGTGMATGVAQKIKLSLENAEWANADDLDIAVNAVTNEAITLASGSTTSQHAIGVEAINNGNAPVAVTVSALSAGDSYVEFSIMPGAPLPKDSVISLYLNAHSDDATGEVKAVIEGLDSQISSGTYTIAVVGDGNTVAKVSDKPKKTGRQKVTASAIDIREVAVNSVQGQQNIKLTLPKGVSWTGAGATVSGDMPTGVIGRVIGGTDDRDLTITFTVATGSGITVRQSLVITPEISVGKDAKLGDIEVQIRSQVGGDNKISDASGLAIATYSEEGVTVTPAKEADIPEIFAGRVYEEGTTNYKVEVTLEEVQAASLIRGKYVDFTFPEWVQIATGDAISYKVNSLTTQDLTDNSWGPSSPVDADLTDDTSSFEWTVPSGLGQSKANKIKFEIPITVDAQKSGDIELTVSGAKAGVDEQKVVVGKAVAPITAEFKLTDLKTGVQKQAGGEIIIKETVAGALRDEDNSGTQIDLNNLQISIDSGSQTMTFRDTKDMKVEVTAGDLEIKTAAVKNGVIDIPIDRKSIKTPGEIKITGVEITLDRTPAEGKYNVLIGGTSIVDNQFYKNYSASKLDGDFSDEVIDSPYLNVITPADQAVNAAFVIGNKDYTANGTVKTMDTAPYIDSHGRTMMPIRYVAEAIGLSNDQIVWSQASQTATIFGKSTVAIKVGSNTITAGGTPVMMDTVAVNNNGRVFVPVRFVANALGANVGWDAATKTVTVYTVK